MANHGGVPNLIVKDPRGLRPPGVASQKTKNKSKIKQNKHTHNELCVFSISRKCVDKILLTLWFSVFFTCLQTSMLYTKICDLHVKLAEVAGGRGEIVSYFQVKAF